MDDSVTHAVSGAVCWTPWSVPCGWVWHPHVLCLAGAGTVSYWVDILDCRLLAFWHEGVSACVYKWETEEEREDREYKDDFYNKTEKKPSSIVRVLKHSMLWILYALRTTLNCILLLELYSLTKSVQLLRCGCRSQSITGWGENSTTDSFKTWVTFVVPSAWIRMCNWLCSAGLPVCKVSRLLL